MSNNKDEELDVHSFINPIMTTKKIRATMSNNKQSSVEYYINNLIEILGDEICNKLTIEQTNRIHFLGKQAKAMHKKESIVFALLCMMPNMEPDKSTIATISNIYDEYFNNENL